MAAQSWTLKGVFKCMLKALRVLRSNGAACFAAPVSGPARGKATSRNCSHSLRKRWTKVPKPNSGKRTPGTKSNWTMTWMRKTAQGVYPSIRVPRPQEDSLTLWTTSPLVFSEICRLCRSNSTSVILQGLVCPPRQFNHSWKPGYLPWIKSQTLSGIHSLLSTRFKNILPRTRLIWLTTQKDMNLRRLPRPFFEKRVEGTQVQPTLPRFTGVEMEDPEEKTSVRSIDSSSQRGENPTYSTENRYEMRLKGHDLLDSWQEMFCESSKRIGSTRMGCFICKPITRSIPQWNRGPGGGCGHELRA